MPSLSRFSRRMRRRGGVPVGQTGAYARYGGPHGARDHGGASGGPLRGQLPGPGDRPAAGRSPIVLGRSKCDACGATLGAKDLVPVVSWLWQRGRCAYCRAELGAFYPIIELAALAVALSAAWLLSGWLLLVSCALGWTLLTLAVIDQRHFLLPDVLTLPLIPAGLVVAWAIDPALAHASHRGRARRLCGVRRDRLRLPSPAPARGAGAGRCQAARRGRRLARLAGAARPGGGRGALRPRGRLGPHASRAVHCRPPRGSPSAAISPWRSGWSGCSGRSILA